MKRIILLISFILLIQTSLAAHIYPEKYYQNQWCSKWRGRQEVRLYDGTRIDCETKNYVVEFDFAPKWAESVGQSLHYSRVTGKKPAIILIIESAGDFKYYNRVKPLCEKYNIALWYMKSPQYKMEAVINQNYPSYQEVLSVFLNYVKDLIISII